jgi:NAD(P)-dependent dehydrogenase (short-subunit alcohol dehydrogenase family)
MEFKGKRILVSGAGKGIGRATVAYLAARGAEVVALSRSPADLDELRAEMGCSTIAVDLADAEEARRAVVEALPLDFLVNNAGIAELQSVLDTTVESFDRLMAVNARAPLILAQEYARDCIARGREARSSTSPAFRRSLVLPIMPPIARRRVRSTV